MESSPDLQFDLFSAAAPVSDAPTNAPILVGGVWMLPEAAAVAVALQRGDLRRAVNTLMGLKLVDLEKTLLSAGFRPVGKTRAAIMSSVQQHLVSAARQGQEGSRTRELAAK